MSKRTDEESLVEQFFLAISLGAAKEISTCIAMERNEIEVRNGASQCSWYRMFGDS